jgi:hypothetical protein
VGEQLTVRSYALTGDARFLRYQDAERRKLATAMSDMTRLTADDAADAARVRGLRTLVDQHTAVWTGLRGIGPDRAALLGKAIVDHNLRKVMLGTRKALATYRADKVRSISERQVMLTRQLSRAFFLAVGIIIAAFLLGVAGVAAAQFRLPLMRR